MDELLAPSPSDPDSSLPSLFPYDSFPIPRGLYAELNRSTTSLARDRDERDPDTTRTTSAAAAAVSTPRGKVLVGLDLHTTLRRPSGGLTGLAPALPVSPPRTASSKSSSPATSPTRSRRVDAAGQFPVLSCPVHRTLFRSTPLTCFVTCRSSKLGAEAQSSRI